MQKIKLFCRKTSESVKKNVIVYIKDYTHASIIQKFEETFGINPDECYNWDWEIIEQEKYFGCMIATENYLQGAKNLYDSLIKVNTKYKFILLLEQSINLEKVKKIFGNSFNDIIIKTFNLLNLRNDNREYYTVNKVHAFNLTPDNAKLCLIDADIEVVQNIDYYLDFLPGSGYVNTKNRFKGMNGGVVIFEKDEDLFQKGAKLARFCINDEAIWEDLFPEFSIDYYRHLPLRDWYSYGQELENKQKKLIHHDGDIKPWMEGYIE